MKMKMKMNVCFISDEKKNKHTFLYMYISLEHPQGAILNPTPYNQYIFKERRILNYENQITSRPTHL